MPPPVFHDIAEVGNSEGHIPARGIMKAPPPFGHISSIVAESPNFSQEFFLDIFEQPPKMSFATTS